MTRIASPAWRLARGIAVALALFGLAQAGQAQTVTHTWESEGLADGDAFPTPNKVTTGGTSFTTTWQTVFDGGVSLPSGETSYVHYEAGLRGNQTGNIAMSMDNSSRDTDDYIVFTFEFDQPVTGLEFTLLDVDYSSWDDWVVVYFDDDTAGALTNAVPLAFDTLGSLVAEQNDPGASPIGNPFYWGLGSVGPTDPRGNVDFDFASQPVQRIEIRYATGSFGNTNPGAQYLSISDITFDEVRADLSVQKTVDDPAPTIGSTVTYTLTVDNGGAGNATGVELTDLLPAGLGFVSASASQGAYNDTTGLWTVGSLASGASATLDITATVTGSGTITNAAEVTASDQSDPDSTPGDGTGDDFDSVDITVALPNYDYSDAPLTGTSYGGASHIVTSGIQLGAAVTAESADYDDANAAGDADDGVTVPTLTQGQGATIPVSVTQVGANDGYLQGWIDWNGDGDFADTGEQVATDLQSTSAGTSTINVPVTVPATAAPSQTFARFRWSTTSGLDTTSAAPDGEVEDYAVSIIAPPILDLNSAATLADTDRSTSLAYTEGDGAQAVMPNADVNAQGENDIGDVTIDIQDVFDGDEEIVTIGGESFPLGTSRSVNMTFAGQDFLIDYSANSQSLNITSDGSGPEMDEAALDALLQSMTYEHTGENPTGGDRDYDITIMDTDGLTSFATAAVTVTPVADPPVIDLDADDSSGATGADYEDTFTEGDPAVDVVDTTDFSLTDVDSTTVDNVDITLNPAQFPDGSDEVVTLGGEVFQPGVSRTVITMGFEVAFDGSTFAIDFDSGADDLAAYSALIESLTYENTSANPTPGDRAFTFQAFDAGGAGPSNTATSTIAVAAVNDPPVIDFDADDSSGTTGADYTTGFSAGDGPVTMTDTDVSITDADDTTLASGDTVTFTGFVDSGNEIVTMGGETFIVGTANVPTFTIGNTTFEVDSDGSDFSISVSSGTGELADWEALFESITYENTSATPTPGDRVLAFTVYDPNGGVSNVATSTISVGGQALLTGAKSFALFDGAATGGIYALPGEDVIYTLSVANTGTGATDTDTVFLVDPLPAEVIFFNGDIDTGGPDTYPGSDPVGFIDAGSGLSFTYASDVGFATGPTAPTNFAGCSYTPLPGYDPAVTHICFNPKGAMAAGDPDPAFSVSFRAGIR